MHFEMVQAGRQAGSAVKRDLQQHDHPEAALLGAKQCAA
jgi:hypothetical protein